MIYLVSGENGENGEFVTLELIYYLVNSFNNKKSTNQYYKF